MKLYILKDSRQVVPPRTSCIFKYKKDLNGFICTLQSLSHHAMQDINDFTSYIMVIMSVIFCALIYFKKLL
jgi:hypothetical protein